MENKKEIGKKEGDWKKRRRLEKEKKEIGKKEGDWKKKRRRLEKEKKEIGKRKEGQNRKNWHEQGFFLFEENIDTTAVIPENCRIGRRHYSNTDVTYSLWCFKGSCFTNKLLNQLLYEMGLFALLNCCVACPLDYLRYLLEFSGGLLNPEFSRSPCTTGNKMRKTIQIKM